MAINRNYKKLLLGLGFDSKDGHLRITKGENFRLYGGSEETHEMMQEKAIKFNEQLEKRRKNIEEINEKEFKDISRAIGLKIPDDEESR
ncbi:MAG: hypothetical protein PHS46_00445 [Candidatus Omnitrophica bacterium]|nr:hypothetical protein [Candidatus Omnitrophota bacterium]